MHRSVRVALPLFFLCLTGVVLPVDGGQSALIG